MRPCARKLAIVWPVSAPRRSIDGPADKGTPPSGAAIVPIHVDASARPPHVWFQRVTETAVRVAVGR